MTPIAAISSNRHREKNILASSDVNIAYDDRSFVYKEAFVKLKSIFNRVVSKNYLTLYIYSQLKPVLINNANWAGLEVCSCNSPRLNSHILELGV